MRMAMRSEGVTWRVDLEDEDGDEDKRGEGN